MTSWLRRSKRGSREHRDLDAAMTTREVVIGAVQTDPEIVATLRQIQLQTKANSDAIAAILKRLDAMELQQKLAATAMSQVSGDGGRGNMHAGEPHHGGHASVVAVHDGGEEAFAERPVFVSYSSKNKELVHPLVAQLERGRLAGQIWLDVNEIKAGQQGWRAQIAHAANAAKVAIVFLSPDYFASVPCGIELDMFAERREMKGALAIVPVMMEGGIPDKFKFHLAGLQYIAWERRELLEAQVVAQLNALGFPPPAPAPAKEQAPPPPPGSTAPRPGPAMGQPPAQSAASAPGGPPKPPRPIAPTKPVERISAGAAPSTAVKANSREAEAGFIPGRWTGWWLMANGAKGDMELTLSLYFRKIRAEGHDRVGPFTIEGTYDVASGAVHMRKAYTGHSFIYEGQMGPDKQVKGTWHSPEGPTNNGTFALWKVPGTD
eukprot:tig00000448_g861.t1